MDEQAKGNQHKSHDDPDRKNPAKAIMKRFVSELNAMHDNNHNKTNIKEETINTYQREAKAGTSD